MAVKCTRCGEELLGAVNRCWKCGQTFALRPEIDGRPPVRPDALQAAEQPVDAILAEEQAGEQPLPEAPLATTVVTPPVPAAVIPSRPYFPPPRPEAAPLSTGDRIDAQRASLSAMGGTAAAFVLGILGLIFGLLGFWGMPVALLGLIMGIWGLYSPRRRWALLAMLLCCLAIGLSSFIGARQLYYQILKSRPAAQEEQDYQFAP